MKIAFDAKRAFNNLTGLGNYSRSVITSIASVLTNEQLYLATPKLNYKIFKPNNQNIDILQPSMLQNRHYWRFQGINKKLNDLNIDIYHGLSNEIPYKMKTKSVVTIHDLLFLKYPSFYNFLDRKIYHIKSKLACQNADKIIATSQQTKSDIVHYFNIDSNKIKVIYQSCHAAFIHHSNNHKYQEFTEKKLKEPFILYVGSIEERKNLLFLLKAIKRITNIKLICVGRKGKYYKEVAKFIENNKLNNKVTFLNIQEPQKLAHIYRQSRGLVYPSINEGFGIPIIEGMYSKIPVITSDQPIFKEIGGENSYYFEQENLNSLIESINSIWTDSNERNKRIEKNLNYVQKFNEIEQAKNIIKLYQAIL